jgi:hypothetical protein
MNTVKVIIKTMTGNLVGEAELFLESGLLKIGKDWSTVTHEKYKGSSIEDLNSLPSVVAEVETKNKKVNNIKNKKG